MPKREEAFFSVASSCSGSALGEGPELHLIGSLAKLETGGGGGVGMRLVVGKGEREMASAAEMLAIDEAGALLNLSSVLFFSGL